MSRGYNARRKAKRQQARTSAAQELQAGRSRSRGWVGAVPILIIVAILAVVGALGFGTRTGMSKGQIEQEVTELLDGIPQRGTALGSPKAPLTVWIYADLECPTVKLWVENYLPSTVETWVRSGFVQLDYRSLQTDTSNEEIFFEQEAAALAAGRQDKLWNFALTFVRQQGEARTNYVTDGFLTDIAAQVPGLELANWRRDRNDAGLYKQVALDVFSGHKKGLRSTPSFLVSLTAGKRADRASLRKRFEAQLVSAIKSLREETRDDVPTVGTTGPFPLGG